MIRALPLALALLLAPLPAAAAWKLIHAGQPVPVARSPLTVTPASDWNRAAQRPSRRGEVWTLDGLALNRLDFFAAIGSGEPFYRERAKKDEPLPKFHVRMLGPEIVQAFEASNRILLRTSLFAIDDVAPATLAGRPGVRFTYHYTVPDDEVRRLGEGRAAVIDGKLYMIAFAAPAIHYFDAGIAGARAIMDSARF